MSCDDNLAPDDVSVERTIELPAPPDVVWDELPVLFADDDRVRVVEVAEAPERLSFWWAPADADEPPSHVVIELEPTADGTRLRVRETRLDGTHLIRSAFSARARA